MVKETTNLTTPESNATTGSDPFADPSRIVTLRREVRTLCMRFPDPYWRDLDRRREYPEAFVQALTEAGWLAALIPARYGGLGYGLREAAAILQEINQSGAYAGPAHAQMYVMGTLLDTVPRIRKRATCRLLRTEHCGYKRSRLRSRGPERIRPGSRQPPPAMATPTSSRVARCSSLECSTPI